MTTYEAPRIEGERVLHGSLNDFSNLESDAEIKHGVQPVGDYEAPTITARAELQGSLDQFSDKPPSDADIKHGVRRLD